MLTRGALSRKWDRQTPSKPREKYNQWHTSNAQLRASTHGLQIRVPALTIALHFSPTMSAMYIDTEVHQAVSAIQSKPTLASYLLLHPQSSHTDPEEA